MSSVDEPRDPRAELADLAASARALLQWEEELGGDGFPKPEPRPVAAAPAPEADPFPKPPPPRERDEEAIRARLAILAEEAAACTACRLHEGRTKSVFARGTPTAELVFVGEGPGYNEDQQGLPFVGPAGQLLDKMIAAMGYAPEEVYICNVVKCRPPNNRTPQTDEAMACDRFLREQIALVAPRAMVALGRCATENLGLTEPDAKGWRGQWGEFAGIPTMATYHPAFLLRSPQFKRKVWEDLQQVMRRLGKRPPGRK